MVTSLVRFRGFLFFILLLLLLLLLLLFPEVCLRFMLSCILSNQTLSFFLAQQPIKKRLGQINAKIKKAIKGAVVLETTQSLSRDRFMQQSDSLTSGHHGHSHREFRCVHWKKTLGTKRKKVKRGLKPADVERETEDAAF